MSAKLTALLLLPLLLGGLLMTNHCMVVDIHEAGPDGSRIIVPVPLFLAQAALTVMPMPREVRDLRLPPEAERFLPVAQRLVEELGRIPDATLVSVQDGGETVTVGKVGRLLRVDVEDGDDEEVHVRVPVDSVADILEEVRRGEIDPKSLVAALRSAPRGRLVQVRDGEDEVTITVF